MENDTKSTKEWVRVDQDYSYGLNPIGRTYGSNGDNEFSISPRLYGDPDQASAWIAPNNQVFVPHTAGVGNWHFYAVKVSSNTLYMKVDDGDWVSTPITGVTPECISVPFMLAGSPWTNPPNESISSYEDNYITMQEVGFWNRELSDSEINVLYNAGGGYNPFE